MKKTILTLTALVGLFSLTQSATAAILPYEDYIDVDKLGIRLNYGEEETGEFNIRIDDGDNQSRDHWGFDPNSEIVTNVAVAFSFYEVVGAAKNWTVATFDFDILGQGNSSGFGVGLPEDELLENELFEFDFLFDSATLDQDIGLKLIADVQEDGILDWSVKVIASGEQNAPLVGESNIWLFAGVMGVEVADVPDSGSTFALFGLAAMGLLVASRRRS